MKLFYLFTFIISNSLWALTPIDGLIYGDIRQYDPMSGVFSHKSMVNPKDSNIDELKKLMEYVGVFRQGYALKNSCQFYDKYKYISQWDEENAKRSVAATLQYIGIDITTKAIVEYVKKQELSPREFETLTYNLIKNNCSKNISVYSLKFIKDNFYNYYKNGSDLELPSIKMSPYFSKFSKELTNSQKSIEKQFELTIKNFRAFCSWAGSTDDYRMLSPYLSSPFVMGFVNSHLNKQKIYFNEKTKAITVERADKSVLVACEDYICRRRSEIEFDNIFPRMLGSTDLSTDLKSLYCAHFRDQSYPAKHPIETIRKWIKAQRIEDPHLEVQQFISLISGIPDILISSQKYSDVIDVFEKAIIQRFQKWAVDKTNNFVTDLLYEESLQIDLVPRSKSQKVKKGEFHMKFDFTLGELDRVVSKIDKINSSFDIELPKNYLRWIRDSIVIANNRGRYTEVTSLYDQLEVYIKSQLELKKDLFLIPMWTDKMSQIMAKELVSQLTTYQGKNLDEFTNEKVRIPIKFRYGLFALKYIREKFKEKYR